MWNVPVWYVACRVFLLKSCFLFSRVLVEFLCFLSSKVMLEYPLFLRRVVLVGGSQVSQFFFVIEMSGLELSGCSSSGIVVVCGYGDVLDWVEWV